jgi:signal transduction histidine kinase
MRSRLFQPFVTSKGTAGNGLGLWVSHGIIKKHGGKIQVRTCDVPGRSGTVFSVFLPAWEAAGSGAAGSAAPSTIEQHERLAS